MSDQYAVPIGWVKARGAAQTLCVKENAITDKLTRILICYRENLGSVTLLFQNLANTVKANTEFRQRLEKAGVSVVPEGEGQFLVAYMRACLQRNADNGDSDVSYSTLVLHDGEIKMTTTSPDMVRAMPAAELEFSPIAPRRGIQGLERRGPPRLYVVPQS